MTTSYFLTSLEGIATMEVLNGMYVRSLRQFGGKVTEIFDVSG